MRRVIAAVLAGTSLLLVVLVLSLTGGAGAESTENIELGNLYFCDPSYQGSVCETTVTAGDTVVWSNVGGLHTVTECNVDFTVCPLEGGFNSDVFSEGESFSLAFDTPGTYTYWCSIHPVDMLGRIIVQAPTPTPMPEPTAEPTPSPTGQTPSPTPDTTPTPAGVPNLGGPPVPVEPLGPVQPTLPLAVAISGIVVMVLGAAALIRLTRES